MSGVVISNYWLGQMGNPSTVMVGTITALYDVGAVFGAILAALTAERLGRKRGLMFGTVLLIIGCVLMGACYERIMMMFGRVFTGLGMFVLSLYQSINQPREMRCVMSISNETNQHVQVSDISRPSPPSTNPRSACRTREAGTSPVS